MIVVVGQREVAREIDFDSVASRMVTVGMMLRNLSRICAEDCAVL